MIDARTQSLLEEMVRREGRSFLQYIADSYPWATAEEAATLAKLQELIAEEREAMGELGRYLVRRRLPLPYLGAYPMAFTTSNFVALDFLLPRLVEEESRAIAALERDLAKLGDPEARAQVQKILDMKRRHRQALEALAATHPQPAAAS